MHLTPETTNQSWSPCEQVAALKLKKISFMNLCKILLAMMFLIDHTQGVSSQSTNTENMYLIKQRESMLKNKSRKQQQV